MCVLRLIVINKRASADKLSDEKMVIQNSSLLLACDFFNPFLLPSFSFFLAFFC